jgi:hypothetical protein
MAILSFSETISGQPLSWCRALSLEIDFEKSCYMTEVLLKSRTHPGPAETLRELSLGKTMATGISREQAADVAQVGFEVATPAAAVIVSDRSRRPSTFSDRPRPPGSFSQRARPPAWGPQTLGDMRP